MKKSIKKLKEKTKNLKILFVEDDEKVRKGTGSFFKKTFGSVTICKNGIEGLKEFEKTKDNKDKKNYDIVVTDIRMPKMDGVEMIEKIKEIEPDVFIVFATASRSQSEIKDKLSNLYITKPISFDNILLIMEKVGNAI